MALYDKEWADEIDEKWRSVLKTVSLVTEVEFTDEELEHAIKFFALQLAKNEPGQIARHHPGIFLVAMTQLGSRSWEAKTFYAKIANAIEQAYGYFFDAKRKVEDATKHFNALLGKYDLAQLGSDAGSYRWVSPVLLHGAVPLDHLDELLDLIKRHIRKDPSMTGESLVELLRSRPAELAREPMALRLFLQHGREFTADYVSRVVDYASGLPSRLPLHITQRLDEYIQDDAERSLTTFPRAERPSFALTPDGSLVLRLPPVLPNKGERTVEWTVRYNKTNTYIQSEVPYESGATRTREETFYLPAPDRGASVMRGAFQTDVSLIDPNDPVLIFDAMGMLLSRSEAISPGVVTMFWPNLKSTVPMVNGLEIQGAPVQAPFGWSGWSGVQLQVEQGSTIKFDGGPVRNVQTRGTRAQLVLEKPVTGVYTPDGMPVFSKLPRISLPSMVPLKEWEILVRDSSGSILAEIVPTEFDFEILIDSSDVADKLSISARGPLGRGFTKTIPVVTGLSCTSIPMHRTLSSHGGVQSCKVHLTRQADVLQQFELKENDFSARLQVGSLHLKVVPASEAYRIVEGDQDLPWASRPEAITANRMRKTHLQVRGLNTERAILSYSDGQGTPETIEKTVRRGVVEFNLRDFADAAGRADRGLIILRVGENSTNIASVRPERLVEFGDLNGLTLNFKRYSESPLTMTVFRTLQPWAPAEIVSVPPNCESIEFPSAINGNGPIRVFAELEDEWGTGPNLNYRRQDDNSKNYYPDWDMTLVHGPDVDICQFLSGQTSELEAPTRHTISRAIQVIHHVGAFAELPQKIKTLLIQLVNENPSESIDSIAGFQCSEMEKVQLLIRTGMQALDKRKVRIQDIDRVARNSPVIAFMVEKLSPESAAETDLGSYFIHQFGQELKGYWDTSQAHSSDGRWDPHLRTLPADTIRTQLAILGVVPGLPLEGDSRIIASSSLLLTQRGAEVYSKKWVRVVSKCSPILSRTSLWDLVKGQTGHEELCLPAASVALSLLARLAAHGDDSAGVAYSQLQAEHIQLSLIAPELTYIDLIRAEAAVTGVLAK